MLCLARLVDTCLKVHVLDCVSQIGSGVSSVRLRDPCGCTVCVMGTAGVVAFQ